MHVVDRYSEKTGRYDVLDIFHGDGARQLKVWSTDVFVLLRDYQETLLQKAGFKDVDFYGSYGFEPYDKEKSLRLIAVARK